MKNNGSFFLAIVLLFVSQQISAQQSIQRLDYLDSLYFSWVDNRLAIPVNVNPLEKDSLISVPDDIKDSVYQSRLESIPSIIPLTYNSRVRNHIDLYVEKRPQQVRLLLGLAEYYFPVFEEVLMREGMPMELKYMPIIESGLNPIATSHMGAQGLWQFMYRTAKAYGLQMNSLIDERWDPLRSTEMAVAYLKDLYAIYNDWFLVIAAYNCGPGGVNRAIRRSGGKTDYWDIYYHLPRETRGYVPAFIAATYAMNFHHLHGLQPATIDFVMEFDTVWVNDDLHFKQVAHVLDIPEKTLSGLNPQYRRKVIPRAGGPYPLRLPYHKTTSFIQLEDSIYQYKRDRYITNQLSLQSPAVSRFIPDPPKGHATLEYTVKSGDVLGYIAEWYDVGLSKLRYWNNIYGSRIKVGQKLRVYVPKGQADKYKGIDEMSFSEKQAFIQ